MKEINISRFRPKNKTKRRSQSKYPIKQHLRPFQGGLTILIMGTSVRTFCVHTWRLNSSKEKATSLPALRDKGPHIVLTSFFKVPSACSTSFLNYRFLLSDFENGFVKKLTESGTTVLFWGKWVISAPSTFFYWNSWEWIRLCKLCLVYNCVDYSFLYLVFNNVCRL